MTLMLKINSLFVFAFQGKLLLIDFNPFGPVTDGLLFTWDELEGDSLSTASSSDNQSSHVSLSIL